MSADDNSSPSPTVGVQPAAAPGRPAGHQRAPAAEVPWNVAKAALDLRQRGWAVVEDVIPRRECKAYIDRVWSWLESLGTGIQRDDPATWGDETWPPTFHTSGIINRLEVAHQDFVWKMRSDRRITSVFAALWGTEALLCSFDSINVMRPPAASQSAAHQAHTGRGNGSGHCDDSASSFDDGVDGGSRGSFSGGSGGSGSRTVGGWWHTDQAPKRRGLECIQGLLNLTPCGPGGGTLEVRDGSHQAHGNFWDTESGMAPAQQAQLGDFHIFSPDEVGFWNRFKAVALSGYGPGSLFLWDSRTVHQNRPPTDPTLWRHVLYVCYQPAELATEGDLQRKRMAYREHRLTTHWPAKNVVVAEATTTEEARRFIQIRSRARVEDDIILRLAGMLPHDDVAATATPPLLQMSDAELRQTIGFHAAVPEAQEAGTTATHSGSCVTSNCADDKDASDKGMQREPT